MSPDTTKEIPTVTDNLFSAGTIPQHLVSVDGTVNGEFTWGMCNHYAKPQSDYQNILTGGTDSTKFMWLNHFHVLAISSKFYLFMTADKFRSHSGITTTSPASEFWGINESILYSTETILSTTAGIVDTGASARK